ncbi:patched domain-containing protein 3-like isoform X2 [Ptychodera flava]|uniref:patched domain-containing protein 3-like isoform X2 n=1 Tax=Ptychodera flava TaxID=63121 RepID=UPI00396A3043
MAFNYLEKRLSRLLERYGKFVASHFLWFIVIPIMMFGILGLGVLHFNQITDTEYLFSPENGPAKKHRREIEKHFDVDFDGGFLPDRRTEVGRYAHALIVAKGDDSVLAENVLEEIIKFHEKAVNLAVTSGTSVYSYGDVCGKWKKDCVYPNVILKLLNFNASNVHFLTLSYPVTVFQNVEYFIGSDLGGVTLKNNSEIIETAKAMSLLYSLRSDELDDVSGKWEEAFIDFASKYESKSVDVAFFTSKTLEHDFVDIVLHTMPIQNMIYAFLVLMLFAMLSCAMFDWVASKPVLAMLGVISAMLAIVSSFGLVLFCGVPFTHLVIGMPFLTLGVGIDDTFIMIASWRSTSPHLSVRDRLGKTFSEAALSITITSITDALAFGIGAISNFPSVRIFCCYCGVAIVFDYIYQLTFFGGCMALIGRREKQNRHCVTFRKVVSKKEAPSTQYKLFCAGGVSKMPENYEVDKSEHIIMKFFNEYYGPFITKKWFKGLTLFVYLGYLGVSIFGCLQLSEGINPKQLALEDSYSVGYYDTHETYFIQYGPVVQMVITTPQHYSDASVQEEFRRVLQELRDTSYFHKDGTHTTQCWLIEYLEFLNQSGLSYDGEDMFIFHLRNSFLNFQSYMKYEVDVVFSFDNTTIEASRCLVISHNISNANVERKREFMDRSREIAALSWIPMLVYHPSFIFDDHFAAILPSTIQNVLIAVVSMLLVSLLLIPQPICGLYVTISITSIIVGVIGFMALWDVGLDFVSMIIIVVCIGFSVDYTAHVAYVFVISQRDSRNERAIESLHLLGLPILQSVFSTILAVSLISTTKTYMFRAIFKEIFLGILFGGIHGLLFLPVFLSSIGPVRTRHKKEKRAETFKNIKILRGRYNAGFEDILPQSPVVLISFSKRQGWASQ